MAQEKIEFNKSIVKNSVFLTIKGKPVKTTNAMSLMFVDQKYTNEILRDFQRLLKDEFPNVDDEEYAYLRQCTWNVWFLPDGSYEQKHFKVSQDALELVPGLEEHLKNLIQRLNTISLRQEQIEYSDTRNKNNSIGGLVIPFIYLRKVIKD